MVDLAAVAQEKVRLTVARAIGIDDTKCAVPLLWPVFFWLDQIDNQDKHCYDQNY